MSVSGAESAQPIESLKNLGCNQYCPAGEQLLNIFRADAGKTGSGDLLETISDETSGYLETKPCRFTHDGICRIVEYLVETNFALRVIFEEKDIQLLQETE